MLNDADPVESRATSYATLPAGRDFRSELEIRRSRFITVLRRTDSQDAASSLVTELRKEFHDARHHCSAFVLGPDRDIQRSNDDGEPSGSAGLPMLESLLKRETATGSTDVSDVTAVVVRYFGGILLGTGGLVRAYSDSVSTALDKVPLVQRRRLRLCTVAVAHAQAGRLENELRTSGYLLAQTRYEASAAVLTLALKDDPQAAAEAADRIATITSGDATLVRGGTEWVDG